MLKVYEDTEWTQKTWAIQFLEELKNEISMKLTGTMNVPEDFIWSKEGMEKPKKKKRKKKELSWIINLNIKMSLAQCIAQQLSTQHGHRNTSCTWSGNKVNLSICGNLNNRNICDQHNKPLGPPACALVNTAQHPPSPCALTDAVGCESVSHTTPDTTQNGRGQVSLPAWMTRAGQAGRRADGVAWHLNLLPLSLFCGGGWGWGGTSFQLQRKGEMPEALP